MESISSQGYVDHQISGSEIIFLTSRMIGRAIRRGGIPSWSFPVLMKALGFHYLLHSHTHTQTHTHTHTHTHIYIYSLYIWSPMLPIIRGSLGSMVPSGSAAPGSGAIKTPPGRQGLGFSGGGGSLGRASGGFLGHVSSDDPRGQRCQRPKEGNRRWRSPRIERQQPPPGPSDGDLPQDRATATAVLHQDLGPTTLP
jgi:hypothetical protein